MINTDKIGAARLRTLLMTLGIVACLGGVAYSFFVIQREAGQEGQLADQTRRFEEKLALIQAPELNEQVSMVDVGWQPIKRASQTLVEAAPRVVFVQGVVADLDENLRPMQDALNSVVAVLPSQRVSTETLVAAQKAPWLLERMARNLDRQLAV